MFSNQRCELIKPHHGVDRHFSRWQLVYFVTSIILFLSLPFGSCDSTDPSLVDVNNVFLTTVPLIGHVRMNLIFRLAALPKGFQSNDNTRVPQLTDNFLPELQSQLIEVMKRIQHDLNMGTDNLNALTSNVFTWSPFYGDPSTSSDGLLVSVWTEIADLPELEFSAQRVYVGLRNQRVDTNSALFDYPIFASSSLVGFGQLCNITGGLSWESVCGDDPQPPVQEANFMNSVYCGIVVFVIQTVLMGIFAFHRQRLLTPDPTKARQMTEWRNRHKRVAQREMDIMPVTQHETTIGEDKATMRQGAFFQVPSLNLAIDDRSGFDEPLNLDPAFSPRKFYDPTLTIPELSNVNTINIPSPTAAAAAAAAAVPSVISPTAGPPPASYSFGVTCTPSLPSRQPSLPSPTPHSPGNFHSLPNPPSHLQPTPIQPLIPVTRISPVPISPSKTALRSILPSSPVTPMTARTPLTIHSSNTIIPAARPQTGGNGNGFSTPRSTSSYDQLDHAPNTPLPKERASIGISSAPRSTKPLRPPHNLSIPSHSAFSSSLPTSTPSPPPLLSHSHSRSHSISSTIGLTPRPPSVVGSPIVGSKLLTSIGSASPKTASALPACQVIKAPRPIVLVHTPTTMTKTLPSAIGALPNLSLDNDQDLTYVDAFAPDDSRSSPTAAVSPSPPPSSPPPPFSATAPLLPNQSSPTPTPRGRVERDQVGEEDEDEDDH